jgi:hypothetical protein
MLNEDAFAKLIPKADTTVDYDLAYKKDLFCDKDSQ